MSGIAAGTQEFPVQQPPGACNGAFGWTGRLLLGSDGQVVSGGRPMLPPGLHGEQLRERGPAPVG